MKAITGSADIILDHIDGEYRYRITRTSAGFLITARTRDALGLPWPKSGCTTPRRRPVHVRRRSSAGMQLGALFALVLRQTTPWVTSSECHKHTKPPVYGWMITH